MEEREADLAKARGTRSEVERDLNEITLKMRKLQGKARALEPPWNVTLKHTLHAKDACKRALMSTRSMWQRTAWLKSAGVLAWCVGSAGALLIPFKLQ
eukprot:1161140-Pelagomonas_calceolata.AAC.4